MPSAKSIRARLLNLSKHQNLPFQQIINRFFQERFLARLAQSPYKAQLILKGGNFIYINQGYTARPTTDIDFLGKNISNEIDELSHVIKQIAAIKLADAVFFSYQTIKSIPISEHKEYHGTRLKMEVRFDSIVQNIQIDIGFGDVIIPAPQTLHYPILLEGFEVPVIQAYTIETVIAEKLQAIMILAQLNSRMKDFHDIYTLIILEKINNEVLKEAIAQTFNNRNTPINFDSIIFKAAFYKDVSRLKMWNAFLTKIKAENISFETVIKRIEQLIKAVF